MAAHSLTIWALNQTIVRTPERRHNPADPTVTIFLFASLKDKRAALGHAGDTFSYLLLSVGPQFLHLGAD